MELTIQVNPTERTVRFREVHALAAGDAYSSVTLSGVTGAQTAALQLKLFKDSSASTVLAQCSSFAEVPGHPSERRGAMTLATQALKDWYESIVNDATATDTNGMPSALVNAWLVISDSVKTWAACQVPLILCAMDTNVVQGADGISPTVTLTKSGHVLTISVTDVNGTRTETVSDGQDGAPGVSPTLLIDKNPSTGNTRVTAVNADGSTSTQDVVVPVDSELSGMSENPVQNKVVKAAIDRKADIATTYTKAEVNSLLSGKFVFVQSLPAAAEADPKAVYLVPCSPGKAGNVYDEYLRVELSPGTYTWEKFGSTDIDLSDYVRKEALKQKLDISSVYPEWLQSPPSPYQGGAIVSHLGRIWRLGKEYSGTGSEPGVSEEWGDVLLQFIFDLKQDALSPAQLAYIAEVPNKADSADLPYAMYTPQMDAYTAWDVEWTGNSERADMVWVGNGWQLNGSSDGVFLGGDEASTHFEGEAPSFGFDTYSATRSLAYGLHDRAVNKIVPNVEESNSWVWANGEVGTPAYANGFWNVDFGGETGFDYDGPVAGSEDDEEITFVSTSSRTFTFSHDDWGDYHEFVFVDDASGSEVRAVANWSDSYDDDIVEKIDYDGNEYVLSQPVTASETGTSVTGTVVVAEHVVTLENTYGPTLNLVMPPVVPGHARDLLVRIDLSQAAGVPPVSFSGGTFETADGEMPELVQGVNLLSFTETEAGVFGVAHKEMKQVQTGGS